MRNVFIYLFKKGTSCLINICFQLHEVEEKLFCSRYRFSDIVANWACHHPKELELNKQQDFGAMRYWKSSSRPQNNFRTIIQMN